MRSVTVQQRLDQLLADRDSPTVALLGPDEAADPDWSLRLAASGHLDVVVHDSAASSGASTRELLSQVVQQLRPDGVLLIRRAADGPDPATPDAVTPDPATPDAAWLEQLGLGVRIDRFHTHLEVTHRRPAYLKLREEQTNRYLQIAGTAAGELLQTRPGVRWPSRARLREAGTPPRPVPSAYDVPELSLRRYRDVRCLPGQVVVQGATILPDSFRHNQRPVLGNRRLRQLQEPFAVPDQIDEEARFLPGTYFYLDSAFRGHFGHAMTEQLSRLWGWAGAKQRHPELKALLLEEKRTQLHSFEIELYSAAGVPADDLVLVPGPVRVDELVAATPMFSQPEYAHPGLQALWGEVSDSLDARSGAATVASRIFCGRRHGKRACHNADEVEQLFADHGFEVVYPEDHPLADQARMFRDADVIGGYAGSALFNLLFATAPKRVIMIASGSYWAQNEFMIASVLGHDLTVAWCTPDRPRPPGQGYHKRWFQSPYTFDVRREGRLVQEVLDDL